MNELLVAIGWTLLDFVWQGALVGCMVALGLTALRGARPQLRYLAACSGLMVCLLWPASGLVKRLVTPAAGAFARAGAAHVAGLANIATGADMLAWLQANMAMLVAAWAACVLALALRMALGLAWINRSARSTSTSHAWQARLTQLAAHAGIARPVRLRIVEALASPVTAGWWHPVVLVPASLVSGMPAELLEALLAHEIAHIRRHDYLVNLAQNLVETILFYHPAVWWISGRIRAEREQIADDIAARQLGDPKRLARALSELEKRQFGSRQQLAQAASGGDLMARVRRLLRPDTPSAGWTSLVPLLGIAMLCAAAYANNAPAPIRLPVAATQRPIVDFSTCTKPMYPKADLQAGHEGTVTLMFLVGANGKVEQAKVTRSSGYPSLDASARDAIAQCRFVPATSHGQAVQMWVPVAYQWLLN
ncbi:M56 family metallopeptidase [Massilia terrae]|uniref:M56 family metallopeptidase n=1 Tax=Massilia terrae TaxID=1811224 RepID=A0ABT2CSR1_9BURK|nr:M56 family metallopeptidase [Massilia terrae]MCS0656996.1 M56 family metallopeptidase [Massilia terrae]